MHAVTQIHDGCQCDASVDAISFELSRFTSAIMCPLPRQASSRNRREDIDGNWRGFQRLRAKRSKRY